MGCTIVKMKLIRKLFPLGIVLGCLFQLSPTGMRTFGYLEGTLQSIPYPADYHNLKPVTQADLDGNGGLEDVSISGGQAQITFSGQVLWQSPAEWQVNQAIINDLNRDGQLEVTFLVRRPFRPWPVDQWLPYGDRIAGFQDRSGQSCNIILIGWSRDRFKEVWAGSSMSEPALAIGVADFDQDGFVELLTLEGSYDDPTSAPAHALKLWEWNGFGFSLLSTLPGRFNQFQIIQTRFGSISTLILAY
jgi:hypothetical protein